jgi:hypothetical protein
VTFVGRFVKTGAELDQSRGVIDFGVGRSGWLDRRMITLAKKATDLGRLDHQRLAPAISRGDLAPCWPI